MVSNKIITFAPANPRRVGRVTECAGLEIRYTLSGYRGFESLTLRKKKVPKASACLGAFLFLFIQISLDTLLGSLLEFLLLYLYC